MRETTYPDLAVARIFSGIVLLQDPRVYIYICVCVLQDPNRTTTIPKAGPQDRKKSRLQEITYLNLVVRHVLPTRFLSGTVYCFNMQHAKVNVSLKIYIYARFSPNSS